MSIGRIISTGNSMVLLNKKNSYLEPTNIQIHSHHSVVANHILNHKYTKTYNLIYINLITTLIQGVPGLKVHINIFEFQKKNGMKYSNTKNL